MLQHEQYNDKVVGFVEVDQNDNNYHCHDLTIGGEHFNDYPKQYL